MTVSGDHSHVIIARRAATIAFIVLLPVLLVTSNIRYLLGDVAFYKYGFREYDAEQVTDVPLYELDRAAAEIVDYFENDADELRIVVSERDREVALFNEQEVVHMKDVKGLVQLMFRLNEVALAYVMLYIGAVILWAREKPLRSLAVEALMGIAAGVVVLAGVGAFAVTGFDAFWTKFHQIAFSNDLWLLDPDTDRLIQMFPEPFWQQAVYLLGAITLVEVAAITLLSLGFLVMTRQNGGGGPPAPATRQHPVHDTHESAPLSQ